MGRHTRVHELRAQLKSVGGDVSGRHQRAPWSLPLFATFVTLAFILVTIAPPNGGSAAYATTAPGVVDREVQTLVLAGEYTHSAPRDTFTTSEIYVEPPAPVAPAAGVPDPASAQAIALEMLTARGLGWEEYSCLVALWNKESGWNVYAYNPSGAYGIPQALPGEKMASAGADWATNPATQIAWGLSYIEGRYATPCGAYAHSEAEGWY